MLVLMRICSCVVAVDWWTPETCFVLYMAADLSKRTVDACRLGCQ